MLFSFRSCKLRLHLLLFLMSNYFIHYYYSFSANWVSVIFSKTNATSVTIHVFIWILKDLQMRPHAAVVADFLKKKLYFNKSPLKALEVKFSCLSKEVWQTDRPTDQQTHAHEDSKESNIGELKIYCSYILKSLQFFRVNNSLLRIELIDLLTIFF